MGYEPPPPFDHPDFDRIMRQRIKRAMWLNLIVLLSSFLFGFFLVIIFVLHHHRHP